MPKTRSKLGDKIRLSEMGEKAAQIPRERRRREILGTKGVAKQDERRKQISGKNKKLAADSVKRVGEYKKAQGMASGGQVCRGMGAATRGGRFTRNG